MIALCANCGYSYNSSTHGRGCPHHLIAGSVVKDPTPAAAPPLAPVSAIDMIDAIASHLYMATQGFRFAGAGKLDAIDKEHVETAYSLSKLLKASQRGNR